MRLKTLIVEDEFAIRLGLALFHRFQLRLADAFVRRRYG